jgi:peptidyl-prolyl cis-trans isomerase B (cyclophilin B)
MVLCCKHLRLPQIRLACALGLLALTLGCERTTSPDENGGEAAAGLNGIGGVAASSSVSGPVDPRFKQSFKEATRSEPPGEFQRPPDLTVTGKSVGKLYSELVALWPTIDLVAPDGKPIPYLATLETDMGAIEIQLRSDLAPNHVRNFVALARLGYYDGLVFERAVHARPANHPDTEIEVLEGGCPLGTGDFGVGSLGYWLKPEFSKEPHDAGAVGAPHGPDPDSASCRFYLTLSKAPLLDGNFTVFGKVTTGLDVARRIFSMPVRNDAEFPEGDRPEKPVVMRKVTITP